MPRVTKTIQIDPTPKYIPPHTRGDREFAGHGPNVYVSTRLFVRNDNELWARVYMHAVETRSDWTTATGSRDFKVWHDPSIVRIYAIRSDIYSSSSYTDHDHADDTLQMTGAECVDKFVVTGDTRGDEAGSRTGVIVHFNPIEIDAEEASPSPTHRTIRPDPTPKFVPPHVGGDREYAGHGPIVDVSAMISIENRTEIWARVYMHAIETRRDYTEASGSARYMIYRHDRPISRLLGDTHSHASYVDYNHRDDVINMSAGELVRRFVIVGDTRGNEAGSRTGVTVEFNPITFEEEPRR